ncbi:MULTISPECIES: hypothetical protein [Marinobacter]|jgi:hypothetical protein|uniref:hypothetical protein n=1 Tax=Marinobacter TaxID=2742 RepID=UPI0011092D23|nr:MULTISPECIES: hypothetical protein [Marinobacter]MCK2148443.1 hypothetical protein [Marinobacter alexandrii]
MDKPAPTPAHQGQIERTVDLDHHDSVRDHVHQRVSSEVERLQRRIETLRLTRAPHVGFMISSYERMIDQKKGFLQNWDLIDRGMN